MTKINTITYDEFERVLREVINDSNPSACDVLQIPGVYEILSEHYNNEVLERCVSEREITEEEADAGDDRYHDSQENVR